MLRSDGLARRGGTSGGVAWDPRAVPSHQERRVLVVLRRYAAAENDTLRVHHREGAPSDKITRPASTTEVAEHLCVVLCLLRYLCRSSGDDAGWYCVDFRSNGYRGS